MQFCALLLFMQLKGNHSFISTWFIPWYYFPILEDFSTTLLQTIYPDESQKPSQFEQLCFSLTSVPGDSLLFWDYLYQLECKSIVFDTSVHFYLLWRTIPNWLISLWAENIFHRTYHSYHIDYAYMFLSINYLNHCFT